MSQPDESDGRVPPVDQLRPLAQGTKSGDRRWTYRVFRSASIYVTWALLHTRVSPNQVTAASLVVALAGLVLVSMAGTAAIAGGILLLAYHLLDRVDGEVARYRQHFSLLGVYLDNAGHYLTGGGLLIAAVYAVAPSSSNHQALWLVASLGAVAAIMSRVEKHAAFHLFSQYVLDQPDLIDTIGHDAGLLSRNAVQRDRSLAHEERERRGIVHLVRDGTLILTWFPVSVVVLTGGFIVAEIGDTTWPPILGLVVVALLQIIAYVGVEVANLAGNLGAESRRLAADTGLLERDDSD